MEWAFLHHPLFQSLALPLFVSLAGIALLRVLAGEVVAAAAVGLSVLVSAIWLMGWASRPAGVLEKLPWVFAGAWVVGLTLDVAVASRRLRWAVLAVAWCAVSWWLGNNRSPGLAAAAALGGAVSIACLMRSPDDRADGVTAAVLAALGLAGAAFAAGSLAIFQLGLILAAALGGAGLWLWPKARIRFGAALVAPAAVGWLALAQASLLLIPVAPAAVAALAAAFLAVPIVRRSLPQGRPVLGPLAVALVAAVFVAAGLALQGSGTGAGGTGKSDGAKDDAYYGK